MRISVVGCGYLGAVHAACLAAVGHDVVGVDTDARVVDALAAGRPPFFEPELSDTLAKGLANGLRFTTDLSTVADAELHFVCVGTPQRADGYAADVSYVDAAFAALAETARPDSVVVGKSTVPVGTAARLAATYRASGARAAMAWSPEFLREGNAVNDTLRPDRVVYGVHPDHGADHAIAALDEANRDALAAGIPRIVTDFPTAELVKVAANSFLATKISFINAMAELCEVAGGDVTQLADAIGVDPRIGRHFLDAGLGFGGGCLPKDIRAFIARAEELHAEPAVSFLREIDSINQRRRDRIIDLTLEVLGGRPLAGARVGVLGAAFKPGSDDIRDSPALDVAQRLAARRAHVVVTDPRAVPKARAAAPALRYADTAEEASDGADVVLLLTDWQEYRRLDPGRFGSRMRHRRVVDGRNVLDPARWRQSGWVHRALGRPHA